MARVVAADDLRFTSDDGRVVQDEADDPSSLDEEPDVEEIILAVQGDARLISFAICRQRMMGIWKAYIF